MIKSFWLDVFSLHTVFRLSYSSQKIYCVCVLSHFSYVWLFVMPWTVAHQAPLSTGVLQARKLECVAMPSSRGPSPHRDGSLLHLLHQVESSLPLAQLGKPTIISSSVDMDTQAERGKVTCFLVGASKKILVRIWNQISDSWCPTLAMPTSVWCEPWMLSLITTGHNDCWLFTKAQ